MIQHFGNWLRWKVDEFDGPVDFAAKAGMKFPTLQAIFRYPTPQPLRAKIWNQLEKGLNAPRTVIEQSAQQALKPHPNLKRFSATTDSVLRLMQEISTDLKLLRGSPVPESLIQKMSELEKAMQKRLGATPPATTPARKQRELELRRQGRRTPQHQD